MSPEDRQEALERHGLTEEPDGYVLSLRGFQAGMRAARALRDQGNEEAIRMMALDASDPLRWEYARAIQISSFSTEIHRSGI
ncbi:hypothetical protein AB0I87_13415 [Streptomyces sp. NPDC049952]|uniref:hypothetical protein n=1 Tax=Streptomyces sp. NPDC049952 TaxID=3156665 RepID=UPI00344AB655